MPTTLDRQSLKFIADWLISTANRPPKYPFPIDEARADAGKPLYARYCASCHGTSGSDFSGGLNGHVGQVDPINKIRTDPCRLDNYTHALAAEQGNLYAAYPSERFSHFRKTNGYANLPLDGIWLRGPYLHNGSVPTLRALLPPANSDVETICQILQRLPMLGALPTTNSTAPLPYRRRSNWSSKARHSSGNATQLACRCSACPMP